MTFNLNIIPGTKYFVPGTHSSVLPNSNRFFMWCVFCGVHFGRRRFSLHTAATFVQKQILAVPYRLRLPRERERERERLTASAGVVKHEEARQEERKKGRPKHTTHQFFFSAVVKKKNINGVGANQ